MKYLIPSTYLSVERPVYGAVESGMAKAMRGDGSGAMADLTNARNKANGLIPRLKARGRERVEAYKRAPASQKPAIKEAATADLEAAKRLQHIVRKVRDAEQIVVQAGAAGSTGGIVFSPPGEGYYLRVPFQSMADGAVPAGTRYEELGGANVNLRMETPLLSWLECEAVGIIVERFNTAGAASAEDQVTLEDARVRGMSNSILPEGQIDIGPFRMGKSRMIGLRKARRLSRTNQMELRVRSLDNLDAAAGGTQRFIASAVVKVLWDDEYGDTYAHGKHLGSVGGGLGGGYVYAAGAPWPSTMEPVPLRVITADALNAVNSTTVRLTDAVNQVLTQTEQIAWQESQVVGLELTDPVQSNNILDQLLVDAFRVTGGHTLFPQEGEVPVENYLGEHTATTSAEVIPGLRAYRRLSASNRATATFQIRDTVGVAGNTGSTATVSRISGWALVNRLIGDVDGPGSGAPFAKQILAVFDGWDMAG